MFALSKASYNWILYLDDDELLGRKLKNDLRDLIEKADKKMINAFSIVRIYRKDKVLYRGIVHELPIVYGSVKGLSDDYYIIHWGSPSKDIIYFYALLESIEIFHHFTSSKIRSILWKLIPFSALLIIIYRLILDLVVKDNPWINLCTVYRTIYPASWYEITVHTLIKFRGKKRTKIAKLISEQGLINLLKL